MVRRRLTMAATGSSAAVYGTSTVFEEEPANEQPLNVYGQSKLLFDRYVRRHCRRTHNTVVGLRYFNVYGPGEGHKGKMASMVYQLYGQSRRGGVVRLFKGTNGGSDGEQRRDFVHVSDVAAVNLFFMDGPPRCGIYNVGTGQARSFNDVAHLVAADSRVEYIPFPEALRDKYQDFTQADLTQLREAGYENAFVELEIGVAKSMSAWDAEHERW